MRLSFRMRILVPVIVAVIISFVATGLILYHYFYNEIDKLARQNAWNQAHSYANSIQAKFNQSLNTAETAGEFAATFSGRADGASREDTLLYLETILKDNHDIDTVWVIWAPNAFDGEDAKYAGAAGSTPTGQFAPMIYRDGDKYVRSYVSDFSGDLYTVPEKSGKTYVTDTTERDYSGKKMKVISMAKPFMFNGKFAGVSGVDINVQRPIDVVRSIKVYKTGYATLVSQDIINISHPSDEQLGKPSVVTAQLKPVVPKRETLSLERYSAATGKLSLSFYVPVYIEDADYAFYFGLNATKNEVFESLDIVRIIVPVVAILAVLLITGVIVFIVQGLMRQMGGEPKYVIDTVNRIAGGDFSLDIKVKQNDTTSLVYSVRQMVSHLREIISNSIKIADDLSNASATLSTGVQELSAGMTDQSDKASMISSASEEMSTTTGEIARNLTEISTFSHQTSEKVSNGRDKVEESVQDILKIKGTVDKASQLVNSLGEKSLEIKNIVGVITNIADQTNLLALNAAIEAARAGDAGRGFAVVADEVRKLAESTQKATSEIAELVNGTQKEMQNVMGSMETVIGQVTRGVESSQQTTSALEEIQNEVSQLQSMVDNISAATQEMSATSDHIKSDINSVAVVSNEVKITTDHLSTSASDLERASEVMKDMMAKFKI